MPEIKGRRYVYVLKGRKGGPWRLQKGQTDGERFEWRELSWKELWEIVAPKKMRNGRLVSDADNFDARR